MKNIASCHFKAHFFTSIFYLNDLTDFQKHYFAMQPLNWFWIEKKPPPRMQKQRRKLERGRGSLAPPRSKSFALCRSGCFCNSEHTTILLFSVRLFVSQTLNTTSGCKSQALGGDIAKVCACARLTSCCLLSAASMSMTKKVHLFLCYLSFYLSRAPPRARFLFPCFIFGCNFFWPHR